MNNDTAITRWALARYLVGRAVGSVAGLALLTLAAVTLVGGVLLYRYGPQWLGVLVILFALGVLVLRALLGAVLRRVTAAASFGPDERQLRGLVAQTRGDVRRELRRLGLPSHTWSMPLLIVRLVGRHRRQTVERLRSFDVERVVPAPRLDELHEIVQAHLNRQKMTHGKMTL